MNEIIHICISVIGTVALAVIGGAMMYAACICTGKGEK